MNTLLSSSGLGILWLALLFALCFALVHMARLMKFGREYQKQRRAKPPEKSETEEKAEKAPEKKAPPQNSGEPIYYIVERKRRAKSSYSEPKRIDFK